MIAPSQKRIAVIGAGSAGLTAACLLNEKHDVTVFEKNDYSGGHTRTLTVDDREGRAVNVDTGFIVMNHRNYPLFTRLLERLDVELADSDMSFSFSCEQSGYAYAGTNARSLFAKTSNIFNREHWKMLSDITRFNGAARVDLEEGRVKNETLGDYIQRGGYGKSFAEHYLLPMGSAIWSAPVAQLEDFPAEPFIQFFNNHGLLTLKDRPQWRYVRGGSKTYVQKISEQLKNAIVLNAKIAGVRREEGRVILRFEDGHTETFDSLVIGAHADEALALLEDASEKEKGLLGAWRYEPNDVVLHTDESVMPSAKQAWASWNFTRETGASLDRPVAVSYHMNRLQRLKTDTEFFVSLNRNQAIDQNKIHNATVLHHPVYGFDSLNTQASLPSLNGVQSTYFCGSYFGYGFHEDAVRSGVQVAEQLGAML